MRILSAVLPVFGIIGLGLLLRRLGWLSEQADQSLLRININLLYPCLILDSTLGNPALTRWDNLLLAPLIGLGTVGAGMLLARAARPLSGISEPRAAGTFSATVGIYNYSYVPLPLAMTLFGTETVGVLFIHNVGVELALWTFGVMLFSGARVGKNWRQMLNAPLLAIVLALVLDLTGGNLLVPKAATIGMHWLAQSAIPMALILIGAVVADHLGEFQDDLGLRVIGAAILLRVMVLPVLFLLLAKYVPASLELKRVMVLQAAMPAAVFPIVMARHYGGDARVALRVVLGTCLVSIVTTPFWIHLGLKFVGI